MANSRDLRLANGRLLRVYDTAGGAGGGHVSILDAVPVAMDWLIGLAGRR